MNLGICAYTVLGKILEFKLLLDFWHIFRGRSTPFIEDGWGQTHPIFHDVESLDNSVYLEAADHPIW